MDEPANMPLRSSTKFEEGTREQVLQAWKDDIDRLKINLRFNTALKAITGDAGAFEVLLANGEVLKAQSVVLAIGTMGNIRKLGIPGEDHPAVAYKLDDASLLKGQQIIVVGAGDSAIEDALALSKKNKVTVIYSSIIHGISTSSNNKIFGSGFNFAFFDLYHCLNITFSQKWLSTRC